MLSPEERQEIANNLANDFNACSATTRQDLLKILTGDWIEAKMKLTEAQNSLERRTIILEEWKRMLSML